MFKINAPFSYKDEVLPLIDSGAEELYCGYISPAWVKKYTNLEFERKGGDSNFTDIKELKQAVDSAHKRGVSVSLAINGLYVKSQYGLLLKTLRELEKVDLDAFIVADLGLLLTLKEMGFKKKLHISTGATVFNSQAVDFYKKFGVKRIVLDRQTSLEEMRILPEKAPDVDFEVFILNTLCVYIDGFCTFLHTYGGKKEGVIPVRNLKNKVELDLNSMYDFRAAGDACGLRYRVKVFDALSGKVITRKSAPLPVFYKQLTDGMECGACALYDISRTGIKSVKIVGRQYSREKRLGDLKFIRQASEIIRKNKEISRNDFMLQVQGLYRKAFDYALPCKGNNCYYPQVLS